MTLSNAYIKTVHALQQILKYQVTQYIISGDLT